MSYAQKRFALLFVALAVGIIASLLGHTDFIAGVGLLPLALGETVSIGSIAEVIRRQGEEWNGFMARNDDRLSDLERNLREVQKAGGRPGAGAAGDDRNADQIEHRKAFDRYLRKGEDSGLLDLQQKAFRTGSDPDGGFLIIPEMDQVIDRIAQTIGAMYRVANTVTIGSAKYEKLVKTSGMSMRRVADGATGGE